ncbi:hypothetical protein BDA96_07G053800 [Sorghum bicolor]|uniref:Uncharacterized protein n=1 Tax=Sorghum bicolor TaxID=4558 RepID=A0A921QLC9_SORBI|nr:hypothetical protein BDA96_07G053800 [Sorghum bicolor]
MHAILKCHTTVLRISFCKITCMSSFIPFRSTCRLHGCPNYPSHRCGMICKFCLNGMWTQYVIPSSMQKII